MQVSRNRSRVEVQVVCAKVCLWWTPHPVIVTIRDIKDCIRVLLYSYYTIITEWRVLLKYAFNSEEGGISFDHTLHLVGLGTKDSAHQQRLKTKEHSIMEPTFTAPDMCCHFSECPHTGISHFAYSTVSKPRTANPKASNSKLEGVGFRVWVLRFRV